MVQVLSGSGALSLFFVFCFLSFLTFLLLFVEAVDLTVCAFDSLVLLDCWDSSDDSSPDFEGRLSSEGIVATTNALGNQTIAFPAGVAHATNNLKSNIHRSNNSPLQTKITFEQHGKYELVFE